MIKPRLYNAIGLMSGTSLDGIDVALIETDGLDYVSPEASYYVPYEESLRSYLRGLLGLRVKGPETASAEIALTKAHAEAVKAFLRKENLLPSDIDVIGFHGQTISHAPKDGWTWQMGNGELLARETKIDVVNDFRSRDVAAGGEGAPFMPLYHRARIKSAGIIDPVVILNIGGVSNVTWIGAGDEDILAFDTGPGNALIDDTVLKRVGKPYDEFGQIARMGTPDMDVVEVWMINEFFSRQPPKSLDRNDWSMCNVDYLSTADAVATLTEFTAQAIAQAVPFFPEPATTWYVAGGGRHNTAMMEALRSALDTHVKPVDVLGWNGDSLEAEGFAYLGVRSLINKPLSLPTTTGVPKPMTGGSFHKAPELGSLIRG